MSVYTRLQLTRSAYGKEKYAFHMNKQLTASVYSCPSAIGVTSAIITMVVRQEANTMDSGAMAHRYIENSPRSVIPTLYLSCLI